MKTFKLIIAPAALLTISAIAIGCGGVPGNSVATVDGKAIEKTDFNRWIGLLAASSGQGSTTVPDPPAYAKCIAAQRKQLGKPKKNQPKVTDQQLRTNCKQSYEALRSQTMDLLIQSKWLEGAAKDLKIKVSDKDVTAFYNNWKKQAFPKEKDYAAFLKKSGYNQGDVLMRLRMALLVERIRHQVTGVSQKEIEDYYKKNKAKEFPKQELPAVSDSIYQKLLLQKVSTDQVTKYYNDNKERFAQPERRDLSIVLTKNKAKAEEAKRAIESGQSFSTVAKKYSVDQASKQQGGKLPGVAKGQQEKSLDAAVFAAPKSKLLGPIKTQFGYYVFKVDKVTAATQQKLKEVEAIVKQQVVSENQNKSLTKFDADWQKDWKKKTNCQKDFVTDSCKNAPATQDAVGTAPPGSSPDATTQPQGQTTTPAPTAPQGQ